MAPPAIACAARHPATPAVDQAAMGRRALVAFLGATRERLLAIRDDLQAPSPEAAAAALSEIVEQIEAASRTLQQARPGTRQVFVRTPAEHLVMPRYSRLSSSCQVECNYHLNAQGALMGAIQALARISPQRRNFGSYLEVFARAHEQHRARVDSLMAIPPTPEQVEAMLAGSMFGWHVPGADPDVVRARNTARTVDAAQEVP